MAHFGRDSKGKMVKLFHGLVTKDYIRISTRYRFSCRKSAKGTCHVITRRGKPMPSALNL